METLLQDFRYGYRMLIKRPGFAAIAVLALALGIGANTAIFSVVNGVLLRSLPYSGPDRLVMVWEHNYVRGRDRNVVSPANFLDWQNQNHVFEEMAAIISFRINLTGAGEPVELPCQIVSRDFFSVLGVQPIIGRAFTEEECRPESNYAAILSHRLWQSRFGSDPEIIGKSITLNGKSYSVVGVMPPDFNYLNKETEVWIPYGINPATDYRKVSGRFLTSVARLKPGVSIEQAQAEMSAIAAQLEKTYTDFNSGWGVNLVPIHEQVVGKVRPIILILLGAVAFVLLIACANVANLLLARAASRQKEMALRTALGAARRRIIRQLLTESLLLAVLGGVGGLILAYWGLRLLVALAPREIPRLDETGIDFRVLAFTLGVSILTGLIFGLLPALQASKPDLNDALKEGGRSGAGAVRSRTRNAFVVAEVALSLILLIGAGLMIRSFLQLQQVNPGFNGQNLLTMRVLLPGSTYTEDQQRYTFFEQAEQRIAALPGVTSVGSVSFLPLTGPGSATSFYVTDRPEPPPGEKPVTNVRVISGDYFKTMGIPLLKGRLFTEGDTNDSPRVLIISETMAREYFPDEDPLGKRLSISWGDDRPDEIIGVVGDIRAESLDGEIRPMIYWPNRRETYSFMNLLVRTSTDPLSLATAAQNEIKAIDPNQPVAEIKTMEEIVSESIAGPRFNMLLLAIFAGVALVLASVGIYGVMSYTVTQRTHEIGLRMALGAQAGDILKLVVGQGMILASAGVIIGLIAALLMTSVLSGLLFAVTATDPLTFAGISLLLIAVALLACYIPARRAIKIDPGVALRYE